MTSLLTNELCRKISWVGIKNTYAFSNSNTVNMIIGKFDAKFVKNLN